MASENRDWELAGFLDANPHTLDGFDTPLAIVGDPDSYEPQANDLLLCGFGDPATKLKVCRSLKARGAQFLTFVHPTATVGMRTKLGEGTIVCPHVTVTCDVTIGDFVLLNLGATVGHDAVIGDGVTLSGHCDVTGGVTLEEGVFLGSHAAVIPRVRVPAYVTIGAGSVVYHSPRAHTTVVGVPAKRIPTIAGNPTQPKMSSPAIKVV